MKILGYEFEGPYNIDTTVIPSNRAAVYVIICNTKGENYVVIDVGESGEIGVRIGDHDRRDCWKENCDGLLSVYLYYMPSSGGYTVDDRRELEKAIRKQYNPNCGER